MKTDKRFIPTPQQRSMKTSFNTRSVEGEAEKPVIEGYFVVFDQPYYIDDYCEEVVARGAFDGCDMSDVRALIDHNTMMVLGRYNDNCRTLEFSIDDTGLFATVEINPDDSDAMSARARVLRGDVDQASFGFDEKDVSYSDLSNGRIRRTINSISKLWEISVCTFPAYQQTHVCARSATAAESSRIEAIRRTKTNLKRRLLK